jgi:hypothetical protein
MRPDCELLGDHNRQSSGRSVPAGDEMGGRPEQDSVGCATLAARPRAATTPLRRSDVAHERVKLQAAGRGPILAIGLGWPPRRRRAGSAGFASQPRGTISGAYHRQGGARHRRPGREYLVSGSRWKPDSALMAAGGSGKTHPHAGRRSAQRTHRRTPSLSAGETGAMSARIIGPPQASSLGSATATPLRARVGSAGAAIVLAAGPHRVESRQPWDTRSDAACHLRACATDASFGAASCRSR